MNGRPLSNGSRQAWFWLALSALLLFLMWEVSAVLLPFVVGMAIAYFLDPVVDWFERRGLSRGLGTLVTILVFFCIIVLVLLLFVPLLQGQVSDFISKLPNIVSALRDRLDILLVRLQVQAGVPLDEVRSLKEAAGGQADKAFDFAAKLAGNVLTGGLAVVNVLSLVVITPVVAFYLLRDWDRLVARIDSWLPRAHAAIIRAQAREIDRTLSGFARGQALCCLFLGVFYAVALSLAGLDFGLIIGMLTGILSFVPYVGTFVGAVSSLSLALIQFDGFTGVLIVGGIFLVGQVLEGYVFQPWLVGDRVGLHPVWMIFALLAGGAVFGFVGILIAIPVTAVIGVLTRFALGRYLASSLYDPVVAQEAAVREEQREGPNEERTL